MKFCINKSGVLYKELLELNNGDVGLAIDAHHTMNYLIDNGFISSKRYNINGQLKYMIPKQGYTEKQIANQNKGNYSKVKNFKTVEELDRILTERDIDWITFKETKNAHVITLGPNINYAKIRETDLLNKKKLEVKSLKQLTLDFPEISKKDLTNYFNTCK